MKLKKALVQNYKSIVNSGEIDIDTRLTIVIGKNEQGKSNLLRALESFNDDYKYLPSDLTSHLRPSLEQRSYNEIPIVTLWLELKPDEVEQLRDVIDHIENLKYLKVTKFYGNDYKFYIVDINNRESLMKFLPTDISSQVDQIKLTINDLKNKLIAHTERTVEFSKSKDQIEQLIDTFLSSNFSDTKQLDNLIKTFCTGIRGIPGQDQTVQLDIASATKTLESILITINQILSDEEGNKNKSLIIVKKLPRFIFHSTLLDRIPDWVNLAEFVVNPEKTSSGMLKFCRAAGLSIQKIQELAKMTNASDREVFEDHYKASISGGLNEFWTQEKYQVHFRIEQDRLSVSISDDTYTHRIPPSQRSDGFQWYLSFYSTIQNESSPSVDTIILLDNPALELHVDGQRDIKKFLEEKVTSRAQIIYVTHSPAMVDPLKLEQIRTVELRSGREGTKVSNTIIKKGKDIDILEPVRSAIGAHVGYSLIASNYNIIVEGMADKFLLEGILEKYSKEIVKSVLINGSISESKDCVLAIIYHKLKLPFIVLLDADSGGREIAANLRKQNIPAENIMEISKIYTEKKVEFTLADLISEEIYHYAVSTEYKGELENIGKPTGRSTKIEKTYDKHFKENYKFEFSKVRVAKCLKKILCSDYEIDDETNANLAKLAKEIERKFE